MLFRETHCRLCSLYDISSADPAPVLLINHPEVGADSTGDHGTIAKSSVVLVVPAALQSNSSNLMLSTRPITCKKTQVLCLGGLEKLPAEALSNPKSEAALPESSE